jgi:hypothetical protein
MLKFYLFLLYFKTLKEWTSHEEIVVEMESHERHLDDISRTTGWFNSIFPLKFNLNNDDIGE